MKSVPITTDTITFYDEVYNNIGIPRNERFQRGLPDREVKQPIDNTMKGFNRTSAIYNNTLNRNTVPMRQARYIENFSFVTGTMIPVANDKAVRG